jgi:hypothetical protein
MLDLQPAEANGQRQQKTGGRQDTDARMRGSKTILDMNTPPCRMKLKIHP